MADTGSGTQLIGNLAAIATAARSTPTTRIGAWQSFNVDGSRSIVVRREAKDCWRARAIVCGCIAISMPTSADTSGVTRPGGIPRSAIRGLPRACDLSRQTARDLALELQRERSSPSHPQPSTLRVRAGSDGTISRTASMASRSSVSRRSIARRLDNRTARLGVGVEGRMAGRLQGRRALRGARRGVRHQPFRYSKEYRRPIRG